MNRLTANPAEADLWRKTGPLVSVTFLATRNEQKCFDPNHFPRSAGHLTAGREALHFAKPWQQVNETRTPRGCGGPRGSANASLLCSIWGTDKEREKLVVIQQPAERLGLLSQKSPLWLEIFHSWCQPEGDGGAGNLGESLHHFGLRGILCCCSVVHLQSALSFKESLGDLHSVLSASLPRSLGD